MYIRLGLFSLHEGVIGSAYARTKGASDRYVAGALSNFLDELGHESVALMADPEASTKDLRDDVCARRRKTTIPRESPKESKGSLGAAESANGRFEGQFRTLRAALASKTGRRIKLGHKVIPWLVRRAGWLLNRFQPHGGDGHTS